MRGVGAGGWVVFVATGACAGGAVAQVASVDLSRYQHVATYPLPAAADEASALTFVRETGTLLVLGDEGQSIVEVTRTGALVATMTLVGFEDTEGIAWLGGGMVVVAEERLQNVYRLPYVRGGVASRSLLQWASVGPAGGNDGCEGVAFDPRDGSFVVVKEKTPMAVRRAVVNFAGSSATVTDLFVPSLGVTDVADVLALSSVASLGGSAEGDHLLLISQESARVLKVTRQGVVLGTLSLVGLSSQAEGVAMDDEGWLYVCDETPRLFVFKPPCRADLTGTAVVGGTGYGVPDGALNSEDFFYYLAQFGLGNAVVADLTASAIAGSAGYGVPNGVVDSEDFFFYLVLYSGGC